MKAGKAVKVRFGLGGDHGLGIFSSGYPASQVISCATSAVIDPVEEVIDAFTSSLTYDAVNGRYTYTWHTDPTWSGTCRQLILRFDDGTIRTALFKFR